MNPGAMKARITIWDRGNAQQASGYTAQTPSPVCSCRARAWPAGTREVWEAYAAKARNVMNFEIRWRENICVGQMLEYRNQEYEIISASPPMGLPPVRRIKAVLKEAK